jgi:hypothetical protein
MDRQIPPELLGIQPAPPPPIAPAPIQPAPAIDPALMGVQAGPSPIMPPPQLPAVPDPMALSAVPPAPGPADFSIDPLLDEMSSAAPPIPVVIDATFALKDKDRPGYVPLPDEGYIREAVEADYRYYQPLFNRFARDLTHYRQKALPNVPPMFDPKLEVAFKSATLSNIVNKLTNMTSATDWRHVVPFKDEKSKENSQIVENWYDYCRECEKEIYAMSGGDASLQWDEFFYLFLFGRVYARILPDVADEHHPFRESLLDPSTCMPIWGDDKEGLVRFTRKYQARVVDVIHTYGKFKPNLAGTIASKMGYQADDIGHYYNEVGEVVEYWDTWNRYVSFKGIELIRDSHKLGYVPFVAVIARGEPRGLVTPEAANMLQLDEFNNLVGVGTTREDLVEKGVSVFHHIINTNRMSEIVYTLLLSETLKAQNPAYITYSAPQLAGKMPPPLKTTPGASNQRVLNQQKVEMVPTSPRPTDVSPVMNKIQAETVEGSVNPAMYGSMDGSNIAGFAVQELMSAARDTITPYVEGFTRFQALKAKMRGRQYISHIGVMQTINVPMEGQYGTSPTAELTPMIMKSTGNKVTVEMIGISDSQLPAMLNVTGSAVEQGVWSRRKAMEKLGEKDPARMLRDIIYERAIEHPDIMENVIIPQVFLQNGQQDLAYLWGMLVVMPKMMKVMSELMAMGGGVPPGMMGGMPGMPGMTAPGGAPPVPGGPGVPGMAPPPSAPQMNGGVGSPGQPPGRPTGPNPGQGRGPA